MSGTGTTGAAGGAAGPPALEVLHRDAQLLVVNKPSGLLVHRGWGNDRTTAVDLLRELTGGAAIHPVHRLDRATSGALAVALDAASAARLHADFEEGRVTKRYLALVRGLPPDQAVVDHPIPRKEDGPRVPALTEVRRLGTVPVMVEGRLMDFSLVEAIPRSGRLHQVRRHLKHLGHPVIGDVNYGRGELNRFFREQHDLHRLALHALGLELVHPVSGSALAISARMPGDLAVPLGRLGLWPLPVTTS